MSLKEKFKSLSVNLFSFLYVHFKFNKIENYSDFFQANTPKLEKLRAKYEFANKVQSIFIRIQLVFLINFTLLTVIKTFSLRFFVNLTAKKKHCLL